MVVTITRLEALKLGGEIGEKISEKIMEGGRLRRKSSKRQKEAAEQLREVDKEMMRLEERKAVIII